MSLTKNRMTRDSVVLLPAKIIEGAILMAITFVYTRIFSQQAYGEYQLIHTNMQFAYLISTGWLINSSARYIGDCKNDDGKKSFFSTVSLCYLSICAAVVILSFLAYFIFKNPIYIATAIVLTSYSMFQILNSMLIQSGKIWSSAILSVGSAIIKVGGAYAFIFLLSAIKNMPAVFPYPSPYPTVCAFFAADFFAGLCAVFILKIPSFFSFSGFSKKHLYNFAFFGFPLVGFSISSALLNMVDRYMVNFKLGVAAFAIYSANYSISSGVFSLLTDGLMHGVYPSVLEGWRENGELSAKPLISRGARLYMLIALPAAVGLFAVGDRIAQVFFPTEYLVGSIIGVSAAAMFFMGFTSYVNKAWELTADTLPILFNSLFSAIIKIASTWLFLSFIGIKGAAFGSLVAYIFYFVFSFLRAKRKFVFSLPMLTIFRISFCSALCGAAAYFVLCFSGGIISLVLAVLAGAFVYALSLALSGEIREEIAFIRNFIKTRLHRASV